MALSNSQYDTILRTYEQKQRNNRDLLDKRRQTVYNQIPELENLHNSLSLLGINQARKLLNGDEHALYSYAPSHNAEISAWGYGTDPYRGWYTEEKQVYDYEQQYYKEHGSYPTKEETAKALGINIRWVQTGHYCIIATDYEYVGLGYNTSKNNYLRNTSVSRKWLTQS